MKVHVQQRTIAKPIVAPHTRITHPNRRSKAEKHAILAYICHTSEQTGQSINTVLRSINTKLPDGDRISRQQVTRYRLAQRSDPHYRAEIRESVNAADRSYAQPEEECTHKGV